MDDIIIKMKMHESDSEMIELFTILPTGKQILWAVRGSNV